MKTTELDFFGALRIAVKEACEIKFRNGIWAEYQLISSAGLVTTDRYPVLRCDNGFSWWPDFERQREKSWSVKLKKNKEIFIWGACDNDGLSYLHGAKPSKDKGGWLCADAAGGIMDMFLDNLFPKDKPQKYRLVPLDDSESEDD